MLLISKICAAILLAVLRLIAGLLPLKVQRKLEKWSKEETEEVGRLRQERIDKFLSIFLCFGAGLLLSTCFVHMFPEVNNPIETFDMSPLIHFWKRSGSNLVR